jgi:hypothetical protein
MTQGMRAARDPFLGYLEMANAELEGHHHDLARMLHPNGFHPYGMEPLSAEFQPSSQRVPHLAQPQESRCDHREDGGDISVVDRGRSQLLATRPPSHDVARQSGDVKVRCACASRNGPSRESVGGCGCTDADEASDLYNLHPGGSTSSPSATGPLTGGFAGDTQIGSIHDWLTLTFKSDIYLPLAPPPCPDGKVRCDFECVDPRPGTCDGCIECPGGTMCCGHRCVNYGVDPNHCGSCFHRCGANQHCTSGICRCNATSEVICDDGECCSGTCCGGGCCPGNCCDGGCCMNNQCGTTPGLCGAFCGHQYACGKGCFDEPPSVVTQSDVNNCGECGHWCDPAVYGPLPLCCRGICTPRDTRNCSSCDKGCDREGEVCHLHPDGTGSCGPPASPNEPCMQSSECNQHWEIGLSGKFIALKCLVCGKGPVGKCDDPYSICPSPA